MSCCGAPAQVLTHEVLLRHLSIESFRPLARGSSGGAPLWEALLAAAAGRPALETWEGPPSSQLSSASLGLYAAAQEAFAALHGAYCGQTASLQPEPAGPGAPGGPGGPNGSGGQEDPGGPGGPCGRLGPPEAPGESVLQQLRKGGVLDCRRVLLPFFAVAPLAWDGRGLDLAHLCCLRLLAAFALSSKW